MSEIVTRRLWKVRAKAGIAYSPRRPSPRVVEVLANGSEVVHREKIAGNEYAIYEIEDGWLVEKTAPAKVEALHASRKARREAGARRAAEARSPAFRAFLREAESELGTPTKLRPNGVTMWAFPAGRLKTTGTWAKRARDVGAAATVFESREGERTLYITHGKVSMLTALFEMTLYGPGEVTQAVANLDSDVGVAFDWIRAPDQAQLRLAKAPVRPDAHARGLAEALGRRPKAVEADLRKRVLRIG